MKTALELLKEIKEKDIENKIKTGAFFLSDEQRAKIQRLLETALNGEYKQCENCIYYPVDCDPKCVDCNNYSKWKQ